MPAKQALLLPLLIAAAPLAQAEEARIVPADPMQFEHVSLRLTEDDCAFDPASVRVGMQGNVIHVDHTPRQCFAPGQPMVVDIQLGAFPVGDYRVEMAVAGQPAEARASFTVGGLVQPAVFPPPPVPLDNYTGIWWTAAESGWGLSLHQGRVNTLVGSVYVFDQALQPEWYTLGNGQWETSTRWTGEVFRSSGPAWSSASYNATLVKHEAVGTATLDFGMVPGAEDRAQFSYTVGGTTVSKTITRVRF
jgi:hypothetical protein